MDFQARNSVLSGPLSMTTNQFAHILAMVKKPDLSQSIRTKHCQMSGVIGRNLSGAFQKHTVTFGCEEVVGLVSGQCNTLAKRLCVTNYYFLAGSRGAGVDLPR